MMLMISGLLIDLGYLKWNKCHIFAHCFLFLPLWTVLFLYSDFNQYEEWMQLCGLGVFSLIALCLWLWYLGKMNVLCGGGGLILSVQYIFVIGAAASKVFLHEPFKTYAWYAF